MLKIFAAEYINLQDNLSNNDKITLLKFVKEVSDNQVKHLLTTGHMVAQEDLSEADTAYDSFSSFWDWIHQNPTAHPGKIASTVYDHIDKVYQSGITKGAVGGLATAAVAALLIAAGTQIYKRYLSQAAKACNNFSGDKKTSCMKKYKRMALSNRVAFMQKGKKACAKTKKPQKCSAKLDKKIRGIQAKLGEL